MNNFNINRKNSITAFPATHSYTVENKTHIHSFIQHLILTFRLAQKLILWLYGDHVK